MTDNPLGYRLIRRYMTQLFRLSHRRIRYFGCLPPAEAGAVILCSNHTNGLCDALLLSETDSRPKVYVGRADMFRIPWLAKICRYVKIMPIYRTRDGLGEVRHNDAVMAQAVEVLHSGTPFCIFPEGTHHASAGLLPLSKGVFRIALLAAQQPSPVFIVPIGIRYANWFRLWDEVDIYIGEPMRITAAADQALSEAQYINRLREELTARLTALIAQPQPPKTTHRVLRATLLALTAPLAVVCAAVTLPIWTGRLLIDRFVEDDAFRTSAQFLWQSLLITLSLWTVLPFHWALEEWLYHLRRLRR